MASEVSMAAAIPSPMPLTTVRLSLSPCSAQSKLSPRTAYEGSNCPARLNAGRTRHRPGSSSHCISAASVSRRVRAAMVYRSVPVPADCSSWASSVAISASSARAVPSAGTGEQRNTPIRSPRAAAGRYATRPAITSAW
jgi:hypothetical protein